MRDIKFEFVYRRKADGFINKLLFNMNNNDELFGKAYLNEELLIEFDLIAKRQYTGLKDKNGVEIYEGDLLQVNANYFTIEYDNGCFWGIPYKCTDPTTKSGKYPLGQILHYIFEDDVCTVIGNIHENKDLLSATN